MQGRIRMLWSELRQTPCKGGGTGLLSDVHGSLPRGDFTGSLFHPDESGGGVYHAADCRRATIGHSADNECHSAGSECTWRRKRLRERTSRRLAPSSTDA